MSTFSQTARIASWNIPNPYDDTGSNVDLLIKFKEVAQQIQTRIHLLCSFPAENPFKN